MNILGKTNKNKDKEIVKSISQDKPNKLPTKLPTKLPNKLPTKLPNKNFKNTFKEILRNKKITGSSEIEDYIKIRNTLQEYGLDKFYLEMEKEKIFINGYINTRNNPFAKMILNRSNEKFFECQDFILTSSLHNTYHKLLIPKKLEWYYFNILTLTKEEIPILKRMKFIALTYVLEKRIKNYGLYFHCYPFNTVNTLHLHIVDLDQEPKFQYNSNNLTLDDTIRALEIH